MECIAIINQKGGVGKTATAVNLGAGLAQRGRRVLLIDMDPQGHLTTHLGLDGNARGSGIYEVLTRNLPLDDAIHRHSPTIAIVPAQIDLAAAEVELVSVVGRELILRDTLTAGALPYDFALLDCPPSLGVLTLNALTAADRVLIPMQPHFLALQGVGKLLETVSLVSQRLNPKLRVAGIVMCMYEAATRLTGEVVADLAAFLDSSSDCSLPWQEAKIFEARIRRNVKLAECPSYGQSIFEYAPRSHGAADYLALADELLGLSLSGREGREGIRGPAREDGEETRGPVGDGNLVPKSEPQSDHKAPPQTAAMAVEPAPPKTAKAPSNGLTARKHPLPVPLPQTDP